MGSVYISVENVNYGYEKSQSILKNITFTAKEHDCIGLIGANGVGKSTLLKLMVGLHLGYEGKICIGGLSVVKKNLSAIREKIGYVFQDADSQLFMSHVYEELAFAPQNYGLSEPEVEARVKKALEMVHIEHLKDKQTYKMSGGEKKLVSIATIPDVILMDEPFVALDPKNRRNLIHILKGFRQIKIIASHDLDMILDTCSRVILMSDGEIIRDGDVKEILLDKELLEAHGLELPFCMQGAVSV